MNSRKPFLFLSSRTCNNEPMCHLASLCFVNMSLSTYLSLLKVVQYICCTRYVMAVETLNDQVSCQNYWYQLERSTSLSRYLTSKHPVQGVPSMCYLFLHPSAADSTAECCDFSVIAYTYRYVYIYTYIYIQVCCPTLQCHCSLWKVG